MVRFDRNAMDGWFEEDEEVYTHPRDPYSRVDILATSRRLSVSIDSVELAVPTNAHVLVETGLPPRWYLPKVDVRMDLLVPSATGRHRPYEGQARTGRRRSDRTVDDVAWGYGRPAREPEGRRDDRLVQRAGPS